MRLALIPLILFIGAVPIGAAQKSTDTPQTEAPKAINEPLPAQATVPLDQLADHTPDGEDVIDVYKNARTVRDVEIANAKVKAQVIKALSIASDVARLHSVAIKSCEGGDSSQIEAIGIKARAFSATLGRVHDEMAKSLLAMRKRVESERSASTRAKEDLTKPPCACNP
jgi:hypothetical protein